MTSLLMAVLLHVDLGDEQALTRWIDERVKQAKAGTPELVRFPMVHHGTWGADYPTWFIGVQTESGPDSCPCLAPKFAPGAEEPDTLDKNTGRDNGRVAIVEGRFTGDAKRDGAYTVRGFEVLRHRPYREGDGTDAKVIATRAQLAEVTTVLEGDKPWLTTVDSFDAFDKAQAKKADALLDKVKKAEPSAAAEIIDSRAAKLLFCCYRVVVAGRFATQDEATALMKELKKKGFANAGVRKAY